MKLFWSGLLALALSAVMSAQTTTAAPKPRKQEGSTAEAIRELKQMLQEQQRQIQELEQQIRQRDAAFQQLEQRVEQAQSAGAQSPGATETASSSSREALTQLQSDVADMKANLASAAAQTQEDQKRVSGLEGTLNRFRWNGDVRVRGEYFSDQGNAGCTALGPGNCEARWRARVRVRLGVVGKLNEDFTAGLRVATGVITDPTSTNETLTNAFERKNFYLDQGYISYNPVRHKWLSLNGGKWAYTWNRTPASFDSDLNPEGFSEKLSWDFSHGLLKNVNVQAMQLSFNEVSKGVDSWASGASFNAKLEPAGWWTLSPTYTLLKWNGINAIVQNGFGGTAPFAPNGMTNTTFDCGGKACFAGGFFYSDLLLNNTFQTWSKRFPLYVNAEYLQNLDAANAQYDASFAPGGCHGSVCANEQDKAYGVEIGLGQQKDQGDWQFGYEWRRQEADSAIASFTESDQRAPTNILQNRFYVNYKVAKNTQLMFTDWIGRTLNTALGNATRAKGILPGQEEPYLNRMQIDVVYTF